MNYYQNEQQSGQYSTASLYIQQDEEKRGIKLMGRVAGWCIIGYVLLQNIFSLPILLIEPFKSAYAAGGAFEYAVVIVLSVVGVLLPFMAGGRYLRNKTGREYLLLEKPEDPKFAVFAGGLGLFTCLVANYITSFITTAGSMAGIELTYPEFDVPMDAAGRLIYLLAVAVIPPMCEEVAIRGAVLQPIRRYGDVFAIVMSSFVFAVLHGNLVQAPFAFIAGLGLGYITCLTGSLYCSMAVHCVNNLFSVTVEFLMADISDEEKVNQIYMVILVALYVVSIALSVLMVLNKKGRKLNRVQTVSSPASKMSSFVLNIPMIIAIIIMLFITSSYVNL